MLVGKKTELLLSYGRITHQSHWVGGKWKENNIPWPRAVAGEARDQTSEGVSSPSPASGVTHHTLSSPSWLSETAAMKMELFNLNQTNTNKSAKQSTAQEPFVSKSREWGGGWG